MLTAGISLAGEPEKYIPKTAKKREKYATTEPGTYLKPSASFILERIKKIMEDSTAKEPGPWVRNMFSPNQKKQLDTLLSYNELEVPVRIYYPNRKSLQGGQPAIVYLHGGGFVLGSVEQYHTMVSKLASTTGQLIVSVDYRLAPEHPYPAALEDCYAILRWMQNYGTRIGADTTKITIMGDSAGGNLATVLTLMCRDRGNPQPRFQVLLYPAVTFMDGDYPSMDYFLKDPKLTYMLSESFLSRVRSAYKGETGSDQDPYISPLEASLSDELAPALIISAECDPLRDSERAYARKLKNAGIEVKHIEYSGMIHGFMSFHMILKDARDAMREIRDFLDGN